MNLIFLLFCGFNFERVRSIGCENKMFERNKGLIKFKGYFPNADCTWTISPGLHSDEYVVLKFNSFELNGAMPSCSNSDRIEIFSG